MIYHVESNSKALAELLENLEGEPHHVWIDGAVTHVYTEKDIPSDG